MKKSVEKSKQGKKNRAAGVRFESKVRAHMEEKLGWTVSKWMNTVDYDKDEGKGKLVPAKRKYNPFKRVMIIGSGFPDFVCFKRKGKKSFEVVGVEVKGNGYLDQVEKGLCHWLIENKIFSRILIAKKGKKRGEIEYIDYKKKYGV